MRATEVLTTVLELAGALGIFLYGMKVMSEALQKVAGDKLKRWLAAITSNRVSGVFTGFLVTCVVQSSSASTVMVVGFVNAQLLSLTQAISMVMGANIGTTTTAWIVALLGFKVKLVQYALPAVGIGVAMTFLRGAKPRQWGEALLGFGLLFLGLGFLKESVPDVGGGDLEWIRSLSGHGVWSSLIFVGMGTVLTVLLQSSSATMTLTLTLTATGWLPYEAAVAMVLGENIGTTATANIASIGTGVVARRAARAHFLFNIVGVIWALALMNVVLLPVVDLLIPGDPTAGASSMTAKGVVTTHLAAFHSVFNITNTLLLLPFVQHLARIVERWIPGRPGDGSHNVTKFISTALVQTPELLLVQVGREMQYMTQIVREMHADALRILTNPDEKYGALVEETLRREQLTDDLEREITSVLAMTARAATSAITARRVGEMALNTHRLERIGDHCEKLVNIAVRNHDSESDRLDARALDDIGTLGKLVDEALDQLGRYLADESNRAEAEAIEIKINAARDQIRERHIERMRGAEDSVISGLRLLDTVNHLEEIGDRCWGIVRRIEATRRM
ncbi:MAG: Na/Pi cotransporter family protein [Nannocystaceae bacterium]